MSVLMEINRAVSCCLPSHYLSVGTCSGGHTNTTLSWSCTFPAVSPLALRWCQSLKTWASWIVEDFLKDLQVLLSALLKYVKTKHLQQSPQMKGFLHCFVCKIAGKLPFSIWFKTKMLRNVLGIFRLQSLLFPSNVYLFAPSVLNYGKFLVFFFKEALQDNM